MPLKAAAAAAKAAPSLDLHTFSWLLWSLLLLGLLLPADCGDPGPPGRGLVTPLPSAAAAVGGGGPWWPAQLLLLAPLPFTAAVAPENAVRLAAAAVVEGAQRGEVQ